MAFSAVLVSWPRVSLCLLDEPTPAFTSLLSPIPGPLSNPSLSPDSFPLRNRYPAATSSPYFYQPPRISLADNAPRFMPDLCRRSHRAPPSPSFFKIPTKTEAASSARARSSHSFLSRRRSSSGQLIRSLHVVPLGALLFRCKTRLPSTKHQQPHIVQPRQNPLIYSSPPFFSAERPMTTFPSARVAGQTFACW